MTRVAVAVVLALVVSACVGEVDPSPRELVPPGATDAAAADPATDAPLARPDTTTTDCPELLAEATCGFLIVPEDREDASGPVIEVAWARLPHVDLPDGEASTAPLVVLPDGPGLGGMDDAEAWVGSPLRQGRDLLLLDPRGAGRSFPSLDCGEAPRPISLPPDLVEDCLGALTGQGIDLQAYDTGAIAADVVDLADALGFDRVDLLGVGFGAKVALTVLATEPGVLRALVLDSPVPPEADPIAERAVNGQAALNRLLDECAEQVRCSDALGGVRADLEELVPQLDVVPAEPEDGIGVTGQDLVLAALAALQGEDGPGLVPAALALAVRGEVRAAMTVLETAAGGGGEGQGPTTSEGLRLSADCRDEVPFSEAEAEADESLDGVGQAVAADVTELLAACTIWDAGEAGAQAAEAVEGQVPTLVLTGEFDPLSPPAWGAAVAARLEAATVVQVGGAGHGVLDVNDCTLGLVADFLADLRSEVDGTCAADRIVEFDLTP